MNAHDIAVGLMTAGLLWPAIGAVWTWIRHPSNVDLLSLPAKAAATWQIFCAVTVDVPKVKLWLRVYRGELTVPQALAGKETELPELAS